MPDTVHGLVLSGRLAGALTRVQIALLGLIGFSLPMVPRLVPILFFCSGLASLGHLLAAERKRLRALIYQPLVLASLAFLAYLFVNSTWAADPPAAFMKAVAVALMVTAGIALATYFSLIGKPEAHSLGRALFAGLALGVVALFIILTVGQPLLIFFHTWFPFLTGDVSKDMIVQDGVITSVFAYRLNQYVANMVMFLLPTALLARTFVPGPWRTAALCVLIAAVVIGTLISESDTAKVALGAGGLVFALAHVSAKAMRWGLVGVWIATLAFAVPLGALPYTLGWHESTWLPKNSVAARFYIWRYTAEKVAERPLTGIGLRGTRELQREFYQQLQNNPSDMYHLRPGRHAHNGYLQLWLELGAIGAGLVLIIGLFGLRQLARWPPMPMKAGFCVFAILATMGATGWGIWQTWLLVSFLLAWPILYLAKRLHAGDRAAEPAS